MSPHTPKATPSIWSSLTAPVDNLCVYDLGVSDHKAISMEVPFSSPLTKPKCQICFRNLKNIDSDSLTADLQHSLPIITSSVSESVDLYNNTLANILDVHAPVKTRTVTFSRSAPWFTSELQRMKAVGRALER